MNDDHGLATLADIVLPPSPDWQPMWLTMTFALVVTALMIASFWVYQRSRKMTNHGIPPTPLHTLAKIEQQWHAGSLTPRETAYRLATVLRLGMGMPQLTCHPPASLADQQSRWETLIHELDRIRYAPLTSPLDEQWFEWVREWLRTTEQTRG